MTAQLIDGKAIAGQLKAEMKLLIEKTVPTRSRAPALAVILIGNDPASDVYVRNKHQACKDIGIRSINYHLESDIKETDLIALIDKLNNDVTTDGILLQLPLPEHIDAEKILERIDPNKDVDGFHPYNLGRLAQRRPLLRPCTPYGVMKLLEHIRQEYKGKHAVIVGASLIVGRPMALELLIPGATVTICHGSTGDLAPYVKEADILVSAVGQPGIIKGEWIKPGATLIDVGLTRLPDGNLAGDIEFSKAKERAAWITPVPGGVGPMTVAMLMHNTLLAAKYIT